MPELSFDEKVLLILYQKFFGEEYPVPDVTTEAKEPEQMTDEHIKVQKMCYLLSLTNIRVGRFSFTWNTYGPYSPGLQARLRELDRKYDQVKSYYDLQLSDAILFSDKDENSLFWPKDQDHINELIKELKIPANKAEVRNWMELLGSIAYISQNVFPHGQFEWVNEELVSRKSQYSDSQQNKRVWDILSNAHLLST